MREAQKKEGKKETKPKEIRVEKKIASVIPPNPRDEKIIREIQKMKVLTPYAVASRFNVRLSTAKDFLEELCRRGVVTHISNGVNVKVYKPA